MTNSENLRDIVCNLLLEIEKTKVPSHVAIRRMLEKYQYLENHERRFISRLTRGTLERQQTLDWMINRFSSVKTKKMKPVIRTILRMSVYQLKYMDSVPVSAICNEAVKLAKKRGFKSPAGKTCSSRGQSVGCIFSARMVGRILDKDLWNRKNKRNV